MERQRNEPLSLHFVCNNKTSEYRPQSRSHVATVNHKRRLNSHGKAKQVCTEVQRKSLAERSTGHPATPVSLKGLSDEDNEDIPEHRKDINVAEEPQQSANVSSSTTLALQAQSESRTAHLARTLSTVFGAQSAPSFWSAVPPADYCTFIGFSRMSCAWLRLHRH